MKIDIELDENQINKIVMESLQDDFKQIKNYPQYNDYSDELLEAIRVVLKYWYCTPKQYEQFLTDNNLEE